MAQLKFNPSEYRGKKQIYIKYPGYQGICMVFDWNQEKQKYEKRTLGLKYYVYKKIAGHQRSMLSDSFEQARKWRDSPHLFASEEAHKELTFAAVKEKFFEHFKPKWEITTFETYESNGKHLTFFSSMPMKQLTSFAVDAWLKHVKKPEYLALQHHSRLSYKHELSLLKQICSYYGEYLNESFQMPCKKRHNEDCIIDLQKYQLAKAENKFRYIPRADTEKFLDELARRAQRKESLALFYFIGFFQIRTGCRVGETCALRWEDIDWESGAIGINKTVQWARKKGRGTLISPLTKTGEPRVIYALGQLLDSLREWRTHCKRSHGLVFSLNGFVPVPYRSVQHYYNAAFKALGMKWTSTHIMRHSFATDFLQSTRDQYALQGQLGHKSSRQTEHYAKIIEGGVRQGIQAYQETFKGSPQASNLLSLRTKKEGLAG
jgi:integrase